MICQCMRRSWEHGTKDKVLNFESAIMCTNNVVVNVVVMNLRINYECRGFDFKTHKQSSANISFWLILSLCNSTGEIEALSFFELKKNPHLNLSKETYLTFFSYIIIFGPDKT